MISSPHSPSHAARANPGWRVLGVLIIVDQVLTYLGPGIDHGAPTIGAGQGEVVAQFVTIPFTTKAVGSYVELVGLLVFLSWVLLAAQTSGGPTLWVGGWARRWRRRRCWPARRRSRHWPARWPRRTTVATETAWQWLGVLNDAAVAAYLAALAVRGAVVVGWPWLACDPRAAAVGRLVRASAGRAGCRVATGCGCWAASAGVPGGERLDGRTGDDAAGRRTAPSRAVPVEIGHRTCPRDLPADTVAG